MNVRLLDLSSAMMIGNQGNQNNRADIDRRAAITRASTPSGRC